MLKINNVSLQKKRNKKEVSILSGISFEIPKSRISLLLGKSGSGKTTLLRCISQLEKEYQGEITCEGKELGAISPKERCRLIGFVPQSYALFPNKNVLDNCADALRTVFGESKASAYKKAEEVLSSLDMENYLDRFPHELSGGQQQRVAIARALVLDPAFILFDEPTSALDPENTERLIGILQRLQKEGRGVVISSQDMGFAKKILDRAYFLEQGTFIEDYQGAETLSQEGKLYQFLYG